ncbi:V-type ATP synthase subunit D [Pinisolibacter sp.]|mgnify:CR=1 FL=1|uniref:V-type ATP synthase subunit D n=1 Tax=Pinisolibacter sp. TaxID=2172024 RepID=UPI002FDD5FE9
MREIVPTRSAALALGEERRLMRQGFEFLDEKRMLLAGEMLRQLRLWEAHRAEWQEAARLARTALAAAVERHGLDALQLHPAPAEAPPPPRTTPYRFLGVPMVEAEAVEAAPAPAAAAIDPSPETVAARLAFEKLARLAAAIGVSASNLLRLAQEYRRIERRAKALENVLLPEVEVALKQVVEQLDAVDQEEAVRVQSAGRRAHG